MRNFYICIILFVVFFSFQPIIVVCAEPDTIITNNSVVDFDESIKKIKQELHKDAYNYTFKKEDILESLESFKTNFMLTIHRLMSEKKYEDAQSYFLEYEYLFCNDPQVLLLKEKLFQAQNDSSLAKYNGDIEILDIAPIVAYPKLVFDAKNTESTAIDLNHITTNEFEKILLSLYENNYVLVSPNALYEKINNSYISIPKGKKPLLLILNDVTYGSKYNGGVDKLILDNNNRIATYTPKLPITERIEYNKDFITILEEFIRSRPSFTYNKARALIVVDGSKGIFGYTTQKTNTTSNHNIKKAIRVINHLCGLGYSFASSGYNGDILDDKITFANALNTWRTDVMPYLNTYHPIYYSNTPYSDSFINNIDLLIDYKYSIIIGCDFANPPQNIKGLYYFPSKTVSGQNLRSNQDKFSHLFNCEFIYDHVGRLTPYNNE